MMNLDTIPNLVSVIIVSLVFKQLQPKWLQLFFYFLIFTFLIDLAATNYSMYFKKSNHFIINILSLFSFTFYFYLFYKTFDSKKLRKIVLAAFILYLFLFVLDLIFINGLLFFNIYSFCSGSILIVLCCMIYFKWLFTSESLLNYFRLPMFWIATGLLFFYIGNVLQYSLIEFVIKNNLGGLYYIISMILNTILFGAFTTGFLCNLSWKKNK